MPFIVTTLPEMSRSGWEFTRIGEDEEVAVGAGCWTEGADVVVAAGLGVVVDVVADFCVVVVVVCAAGFVVVVVGCVAGFVLVVVCTGFFVAGGGSSAGGGIGCGSGRDAPERHAQRNTVRKSAGRKNARKRSPVRGIRAGKEVLPTRSFMRYAPGNVRMGFGSTKTAGRR